MDDKEQAAVLYEASVDEIAAFKQQQWHVAYLAILAYSAIVAAAQLGSISDAFRWAAIALVAVILVASIVVQVVLERSIGERRLRLASCRAVLTKLESLRGYRRKDPALIVCGALVAACVIGGLVAGSLIYDTLDSRDPARADHSRFFQ